MSARVAVAMAVYNDARYLPFALEALARQTCRDFHLVLLDDGSSDGSPAIAERYADRLPMTLLRAPHRGRHDAKRAVADAAPAESTYLLILDSDIAPPPDTLERMVALLDGDPRVGVVSGHARADAGRPYGAGQAFLEDTFLYSNTDEEGNGRWICGGCAMFRRSVLDELPVRGDLLEDSDISQKVRARWRLLTPRNLVVTHYGVPITLGGLLRRFHRDGVRVQALLRAYPEARQIGNVARLVPLPIAVLGAAGVLTWQPSLVAVAGLLGATYLLAFIAASRKVPAPLATRLRGTLTFAFGNLAFGAGYLQAGLRALSDARFQEPSRSY